MKWLVALLLISPAFILSNGEWYKTYGGNKLEIVGKFIYDENGFIIASSTMSYGISFDILLFKVNDDGIKQWEKRYGGGNEDVAHSILKDNNGYVIIGYTFSYGNGESDIWLVKVDKEGNEIWNKRYGWEGKEYGIDGVVVEDGYIIVGVTNSFGEQLNWDICVFKIDKEGNVIWNKIFGGEESDWATCIEKDGDELLIGGYTSSYTSISWDAWLIKLDSQGNEIWNRTYGGGDVDTINDILAVEDGYIVVGDTMSYGKYQDAFIMKLDKNGNQQWTKIYGGDGWDVFSVIKEIKNGYIIAGRTDTYGAGSFDAWLIKLDSQGNEIWNRTYGWRLEEIAHDLIVKNNSYYILADTRSIKNGDVLLIKCSDYAPPMIKITKPKEGYLYVFDREVFFIGKTLVIGKITVEVMAEGSVDRVEFYAYSEEYATEPLYIDYDAPYSFTFSGKTSLLYGYAIDAVAYYGGINANVGDRIIIKVLNFGAPSGKEIGSNSFDSIY